MNPRRRLILLLTAPVFGLVVLVVRAAWLAYLRTLSLGELHTRIFDHSTTIALGVWGLCVVLTALIMWAITSRFSRPQVKDDSKAV
jgi:type VI protein secretion system component VasK